MVLLIIIPMKNGYFIGNIPEYTLFSDKPMSCPKLGCWANVNFAQSPSPMDFTLVQWPKGEVPAPTSYPMPISPWWVYPSLSGLYLGSESLFPVPKRFTNFPTLHNEPGPWNWYDPLMLGYNRSHYEGSRFFVGHTYPIPAGSFTQVLVLYFNFHMRLVKSKSFGGLV